MSFALSDAMREYIDARVASGQYGYTSEHIRDLIRKDQEEQALLRVRTLIEEGLASGEAKPRSKSDVKELRALAMGKAIEARAAAASGAQGPTRAGDLPPRTCWR